MIGARRSCSGRLASGQELLDHGRAVTRSELVLYETVGLAPATAAAVDDVRR